MRGTGELPGDPLQPDHPVQGAGGDLKLGKELVQVPAQAALVIGAGANEVLAMVEQQLDLHRLLVEIGGRQVLDSLLQRRPGDVGGVDRIGLATLARALARFAHQFRGDPDDPLAVCDQEALQAAGDVPAVLDRPDPLGVQAASPVEVLGEAGLAGGRSQLVDQLAGAVCHRYRGVGVFVGVRSDHNHSHRPFHSFGHWTDLRRTDLTWGDATLL